MNRQTSKEAFRRVEREIRTDKEMQSYIRQTYAPATIIRQVTDKNWNDDVLHDRLVLKSLTGTAVSPCWLRTLKSSIKTRQMSLTF